MISSILYIAAAVLYFVAFIAIVYPILPGGLFYVAAIVLLGFAEGFASFTILFWVIQVLIAILLFVIDYAVNYFGIKKSGGSKAAAWGSLIGIIIGPFIIPVVGILAGALLGAIIGELIAGGKSWKELGRVGVVSAIGFIVGVVLKGIVMAGNLLYIIVYVL